MKSEPARDDKFTSIYALWAGGLFLLCALSNYLDRIFNLYLLLVPLLLLPTLVVAVSLLVSLIGNAVKRRWRRCVSVVAGPLVAASAFVFVGYLGINPDRIRFELTKSYYTKLTVQMPREGADPLFMRFDWGSTGGAGAANIFHMLVFDESDEVALPLERRSDQWRQRAGTQMPSMLNADERHSIQVKKMGGHFYLITEVYQ